MRNSSNPFTGHERRSLSAGLLTCLGAPAFGLDSASLMLSSTELRKRRAISGSPCSTYQPNCRTMSASADGRRTSFTVSLCAPRAFNDLFRPLPQALPKFLVNRDGIAGRQPFQQQRLQARLRFPFLRTAQQAAKIFADVAIALARDLSVDELLEG